MEGLRDVSKEIEGVRLPTGVVAGAAHPLGRLLGLRGLSDLQRMERVVVRQVGVGGERPDRTRRDSTLDLGRLALDFGLGLFAFDLRLLEELGEGVDLACTWVVEKERLQCASNLARGVCMGGQTRLLAGLLDLLSDRVELRLHVLESRSNGILDRVRNVLLDEARHER